MQERLVIHLGNSKELICLTPEQILYVIADGNYCNVYLTDGGMLETLSYQRAEIAREIDNQLPFAEKIRFALVGRSYLVNLDFVLRIQPYKQLLTFSTNVFGSCKKQSVEASVKALNVLTEQMNHYIQIRKKGVQNIERALIDDEIEAKNEEDITEIDEKNTEGMPKISIPKGIEGTIKMSTTAPISYETNEDEAKLIGINICDDELRNLLDDSDSELADEIYRNISESLNNDSNLYKLDEGCYIFGMNSTPKSEDEKE